MEDYSIVLRGGGVTVELAPDGELCLLENGTEGFGRVDGAVTLAEYALSGGGYPVSRHVSRREIVLTAEVRAAAGTAAFTDLRARLLRLMDPLTDVELTAENGQVQHPSVTLPGGTLSLRCTIGAGEHVVIDTRPRTKTILVNGTPSLCFTPGSVFAGIPRGASDMVLSAESGIQYLRAQLSFVPLYYGV